MQKKSKKFKVIKNKYVGTNILGKDPTVSDDDIDFWNKAMSIMCNDIGKPEMLDQLIFKTKDKEQQIKLI